jgi:indolepyruvate ferredoxin oxidoreductase beta subunit
LKPGGGAVVCRDTLPSVLDALGDSAYRAAPLLAYLEGRVKRLVLLDGRTIAKACGSAKALNVALLGAAVGGGLLAFPPALLMETLAAWIKPSLFPMNERAFQIGLETGAKEARA